MVNGIEVELEHVLIFIVVAFVLYHVLNNRSGCGCNREYFTPLNTIQTSLDESINNPNCCISNTAGYSTDPIAISEAAPGFATRSAYANPCN